MKQQFLTQSPLLILPLIALFLFLGVYLAVFLRTLLRGGGAYEPVSRLPLDDGESPKELHDGKA